MKLSIAIPATIGTLIFSALAAKVEILTITKARGFLQYVGGMVTWCTCVAIAGAIFIHFILEPFIKGGM